MLNTRCHQYGAQYGETDLKYSIEKNSKVRFPPLTHQRSPLIIASAETSLKISNNFKTYPWYKMSSSMEKLRMASNFINKFYMYHLLFMYLLLSLLLIYKTFLKIGAFTCQIFSHLSPFLTWHFLALTDIEIDIISLRESVLLVQEARTLCSI
ncbi:unnamed protein product [Blepharisma stoltei]|uniref:Uncharacterized protein n=1 Tax=Blepharisma stoltei TaxID=1481888 RepID=A0AAU9K733_9CILI|nr:unnamed protein product [Blepharisma stoltei]